MGEPMRRTVLSWGVFLLCSCKTSAASSLAKPARPHRCSLSDLHALVAHKVYKFRVDTLVMLKIYIVESLGRSDSPCIVYGRSNCESVASPEAVPFRSAPPTSGIFIKYRIRSTAEWLRHINVANGGARRRAGASLSRWHARLSSGTDRCPRP
eukprot:6207567-Pleurochrysis_carterae.AAC.2